MVALTEVAIIAGAAYLWSIHPWLCGCAIFTAIILPICLVADHKDIMDIKPDSTLAIDVWSLIILTDIIINESNLSLIVLESCFALSFVVDICMFFSVRNKVTSKSPRIILSDILLATEIVLFVGVMDTVFFISGYTKEIMAGTTLTLVMAYLGFAN